MIHFVNQEAKPALQTALDALSAALKYNASISVGGYGIDTERLNVLIRAVEVCNNAFVMRNSEDIEHRG